MIITVIPGTFPGNGIIIILCQEQIDLIDLLKLIDLFMQPGGSV